MCPDTFIAYFSCMSVCRKKKKNKNKIKIKIKIKFSRQGRSRRLGFAPVARGRSRVTDRVTGQGALGLPRRL